MSPKCDQQLRLSAAHNVLTGGAIGHISRSRTYNTASYVPVKAPTDRWFHYDQVGSVMIETNSSSGLAQRHFQDAFGNTLADWASGQWGGDRDGWHHNTKERDANTGLVYMYQRWYLAETGTFASQAPYPPMMEHQFSFASQNPVRRIDPDGRCDGGSYAACVQRAGEDIDDLRASSDRRLMV